MRARISGPVAALVLLAAPLSGQSLFNSAGLGLPLEALDGQARGLGSFGIGLPGASLLPSDPAGAARLLFASGTIAAQPSWVDFTQDGSGETRYSRGSRFPLLGVAYPVWRGTATFQLTSFLDQRFDGERAATVDLGGMSVPATDLFRQDGSVSTLSLGYARMLNADLAVGIVVGRYAGTVERRLARTFEDSGSAGQVAAYESAGLWTYSGQLITGGVSADLSTILRVATSVTWSTDLDANASEETLGADRSFDLPLQIRLGLTATLVPGLAISASAVRADWSGIGDDLSAGTEARSTSGFGVGLELSQVTLLGKQAPLRLGYRRSGLPFTLGTGEVDERIYSGGLALTLNQTEEVVLATADLALERGLRSGGGITENFWRGTVSIRLSSF